ncbi:MAG: Ig-like domain-containing protein, partial [Gemmatimonadota bacterium]
PVFFAISGPAVTLVQGLGGGRFRAVVAGRAVVSAVAAGDPTIASGAVLHVRPRAASAVVTPAAVTLAALGETAALSAAASDSLGHPVAVSFTWSSADSSVASVDAAGLVTARAAGGTQIRATADGGVTATAEVTVGQVVRAVDVEPGSLSFSSLHDTTRLSAVARDANGHAVAGASITWSVTNPAILTVDSTGLVTARSNGQAYVRASADQVRKDVLAEVAQVADSLAVAPAEVVLRAPGDTARVAAVVFDAGGSDMDAPRSWRTGNAQVATVDSTGLVRAAGPGDTWVHATSAALADSARVRVLIPNLVLTRLTLTPAGTVHQDSTLAVRVTIHNAGTAEAPAAGLRLAVLDAANDTVVADTVVA